MQHQIKHVQEIKTYNYLQRNIYIPQAAIPPFLNESRHNKTHRCSHRLIDKNLQTNINNLTTGPPTGPQDIFIEHYDCEINDIYVKYYEIIKISTCKFKPMDLEMEKTGVQLLSRAKAIDIKAFAVEATIKESVHWCLQHTDYIRASRQSYYYSDATRSKVLDPEEVRNELARIRVFFKKY